MAVFKSESRLLLLFSLGFQKRIHFDLRLSLELLHLNDIVALGLNLRHQVEFNLLLVLEAEVVAHCSLLEICRLYFEVIKCTLEENFFVLL